MLEKILDYEHELFHMLNGSNSLYMDRFMWLYSGRAVWIPVAIFIAIILLYKKGWKECIFIVLAIALVVTLCDQFASGFCKPMFGRFRPTHHPDFMNDVDTVFDYRGGRYGFISSHAANAFGFAAFMARLFRNIIFSWVIYIWAAITAYSRVYLGVHFISDIIPGIIVGIAFGYIVYKVYRWSRYRVLVRMRQTVGDLEYTQRQKMMAAFGIVFTVIVLLLLNAPLVSWVG